MRQLTVRYKPAIEKWTVEGPTAGWGVFDTKQAAMKEARKQYRDKEYYVGINVYAKNGGLSMSQSVGDHER